MKELFELLKTPIETENLNILRNDISKCYVYMPVLIKLKAQAEAMYRLSQKNAVKNSNLKGTGREAEINGETAQYRYVRDYLEGMYEALKSKISASKTILSSLDTEAENNE